MPPMGINDVVFGDMSEPEVKGHDGVFQVIFNSFMRLKEHILNDVTCVFPGGDSGIKPEADHSPQRFAMAV